MRPSECAAPPRTCGLASESARIRPSVAPSIQLESVDAAGDASRAAKTGIRGASFVVGNDGYESDVTFIVANGARESDICFVVATEGWGADTKAVVAAGANLT